jgi:hypothetical protein
MELTGKDNNLTVSHKEKDIKEKEKNIIGSGGKMLKKSVRYPTKDKELGSFLFSGSVNNNTSYNKKYKTSMMYAAKENKDNKDNNINNILNTTNLEVNTYSLNNQIVLDIKDFEQILNNAFVQNSNNPVVLNTHSSQMENSLINMSQSQNPKSKKLTKDKLDNHFLQTNYADLYNYLLENNLSIPSFIDVISHMDKIFSIGDKDNQMSYSILILKANSIKKINRDLIEKYQDVELNRSYLFILEGLNEELEKFRRDLYYFTEALGNHDEMALVNMVTNQKLEELKESFEVVSIDNYSGNKKRKNYFPEEKSSPGGDDKNLPPNSKTKKKIVYQCIATRILPDKYQNGIFVIYSNNPENQPSSSTLCEFIPVNNNPKKKSLKFTFYEVRAMIKFRFLYQFKAINLFLHTRKRSKVLDFETEENYVTVFEYLKENCPKIDKNFTDVKYHTNLWVDGLMSNYDYLMYLNIMGGRSFDDLGQYPIMPWVISNYEDEILDLNDLKNFRDLSKPIGALNPKRLKALKDNYQELKEQGKEYPFLYGTYYSFPYIVFYYLIRTHPFYFLRFQGGTFGPTDRLFFSIKESWNSSIKNSGSQDVKELIPEFYNSDGDFLKNIFSLNFGKTQLDEVVNDVALPKWAKSPKDFVTTMRAALESEIVSSSLHLWIDLVFGYRQRGDKALEADNLFHPLRYDDMLHLVLDKSDDSRQGDIDNIFEFGQIPIQLFLTEPHPKKRSRVSINEIRFESTFKSDSGLKATRLKKERVNIEKKYEKERRQKDLEIEDIQKKLEERQKEFMEQIKGYDE